ncbi:MAG: SufD family Fe-S cluster assembly protein, partial [Pseudobdellovibrionaceae bacterium]
MNLQNAFQKFNQTRKAYGPWGFVRQNGFRYFQQHGLPSKALEAWKYTSLKNLPESQLEPQDYDSYKVPKDLAKTIKPFLNPEFFNLVFLNGAIVEGLSDLKALKKIKVVGIEEVKKTSVFSSIRKARKQLGSLRQDAMEALNSAFVHGGVVIEVPADTSLAKPLQVLYFQNSGKATYPKTLVKVGRGSKLSLVESYVGTEQKSLTNTVTEILIEESAKLEYLRIQVEGLNTTSVGCTRIFLMKDASLESLSYATGALLNRHNLDVYCLGEYASAQVNGLTLGFGNQHHDNHTLIDHVVGNCTTT